MRRLQLFVSSTALFLFPTVIALAQRVDESNEFRGYLASITNFINGVLIPFIVGIGFLFFVWGMFQFFIAGGSNDEAKEKGKSLMIYATAGFVLIFIFWGVINLLSGATGLDDPTLEAPIPVVPPLR